MEGVFLLLHLIFIINYEVDSMRPILQMRKLMLRIKVPFFFKLLSSIQICYISSKCGI